MARIVALGCVVVSLLLHYWNLRPLDDGDIFTHIIVGRWLPDYITLTEAERSTQTHISWLAYVAFGAVDKIAGLWGIKAFNLLLLASSFLTLFFWQARVASRQRSEDPSIVSLIAGSVGACFVAATNVSARPQSFAYLCFCGLLLALEAWSTQRKKWIGRAFLLCVILMLWQNCHPSVLLSIPVVGAYIVFRGIPRWFIAIPLVATLCTPDGWSLCSISAYNMNVSRNMLKISEWMPPWHPSVRGAMEPFWIVAVLSSIGLCVTRWRAVKADPLVGVLSGGFLLLTLTSARFGSFWGFVHAPLLGELWYLVWPGTLAKVCTRRVSTTACSVLACLATFALKFNPGSVLPVDSPIDIFRSLLPKYPHARVFNYREFGGALEYVGYPDWKVFIDGRLYLFDPEIWNTYHSAAVANNPALIDALIDHHDLFALHSSYHSALIKVLNTDKRVTLVINRNSVVVFARNANS